MTKDKFGTIWQCENNEKEWADVKIFLSFVWFLDVTLRTTILYNIYDKAVIKTKLFIFSVCSKKNKKLNVKDIS